MKTTLFALAGILISLSLEGAEPAKFKFMVRGYCYASSDKVDKDALGGFGESNNHSKAISKDKLLKKSPYLNILPDKPAVFAGKYDGIIIKLVNGSNKELGLSASDSRIDILQEALDKDGKWKPVEYFPSSWCGNSYHRVYLKPGRYWEFTGPRYSGPRETLLRFKIAISQTETIYSEPYKGGVHPDQFKKKQGHEPSNLMDPYNE